MIRSKSFYGLFFLLFFVFLMGPTRAFDIDISSFKLKNGMEFFVIPDHRAPIVTHMMFVKAGAADEVWGAGGIAHFLEHLMFKGTQKNPGNTYDRTVKRLGGTFNASTTQDWTNYHEVIPKEHLGKMMELDADRLMNIDIPQKVIDAEREVVIEERRMRVENQPWQLLQEQVDAALYMVHPYRRPVIGVLDQIRNLSHKDAMAFYQTYYTPASAFVIVAGDVTVDEVKKLAEKHYGNLTNRFTPKPRVRLAEPAPIAPRRVTLTDKRATSPGLVRSYMVPSYASGGVEKALRLQLLSEVLGGGKLGRLYQKLVVEDKIASAVQASYNGHGLDGDQLVIFAIVNPGIDIAKVETAIDEIIADVKVNGVSQKEVDRVRTDFLNDLVYVRDSQMYFVYAIGTALATGSTLSDVLNSYTRLEQGGAEDLRETAKLLDIKASVTGILLPDEAEKQQGTSERPSDAETTK